MFKPYRVINMEIEYYKIIKKLHLIIFLVLYKIIDFWYMFKFKEPWHIISVVPLKNIFFDNNCVGKINRNTMNHRAVIFLNQISFAQGIKTECLYIHLMCSRLHAMYLFDTILLKWERKNISHINMRVFYIIEEKIC